MSGGPDRERHLQVSAIVWRVVHGSDFVPNNGADGREHPKPLIPDPFFARDFVRGGRSHLSSNSVVRDE